MTLLALVGAALAPALYQMGRRPVLRRLAIRELLRRRGETALVIAGSLLGTAIITGSFIVGDTLDSSIRQTAVTQLGPVDELIALVESDEAREIKERIVALDDPRVDGVTSVLTAPASIFVRSRPPRAEPRAQLLELDFGEGRSFGGDPDATGIEGPDPGEGEAVVTSDLAEVLEVEPGDEVTASLYGSELRLEVARVLPRLGLAGFSTADSSTSPNAFVAPGTISGLAGSRAAPGAGSRATPGVAPPVTQILISNEGDVFGGAELTDEVVPFLEETLGEEVRAEVEPIKERTLQFAATFGDSFSELFVGIGAFAIIAGILLLVQIFVMLAEERKSQLGMLRAVGLRRSDLVRTFYIQGAIHALASAILGTVLGIGVGWAIVRVAAPIFGTGDFSLDLLFDLEPASLVTGFSIGILISLATVFLTSLRISRINIIMAIRDLQEPKRLGTRLRTLILGILVAIGGAASFFTGLASDDAWAGVLLGPPLVAFGLLPSLGKLVGRRPATIVVALFTLAWGVVADSATGGKAFGSGDIFAFVLQGVILNVAAVVLLSQIQENVAALLSRITGRSLAVRLGLSYPLARRFRTGLTLGMFSLVIFTMVFISVLSNVFGGQIENTLKREAGGFDILAHSVPSDAPSATALEGVEGVDEVSVVATAVGFFSQAEAVGGDPDPWPVSGIDESFARTGPPELEEIPSAMGSDREAWRALLRDPSKMVVPQFFLQNDPAGPAESGIEIGDSIRLTDPLTGRSVEREVLALSASTEFSLAQAYMSRSSVEEAFGEHAAPARFFIKTSEDAAPAEIAEILQGRFLEKGLEARTFRSIVEETQAQSVQFLRLMQGYLALGLLVGIAGIGVVMVRAVRERRRQVGVLRALGFLPAMVRRAFLLESAFTALEGLLVGTALALVTAYQLIQSGEFGQGIDFTIPWPDITLLLATAALASLLATAWPAQQASKIAPAVALRIAD